MSDANSRFKEAEVREKAKCNVYDESTRLGLLPICAGILREIIPTRTSFSRTVALARAKWLHSLIYKASINKSITRFFQILIGCLNSGI